MIVAKKLKLALVFLEGMFITDLHSVPKNRDIAYQDNGFSHFNV